MKQRLNLSADSKLSTLLDIKEAKSILRAGLPQMADKLENQASLRGFTLRRLVDYSAGAIPAKTLDEMDRQLKELCIFREGFVEGGTYSGEYPLTGEAAEVIKEAPHTSIHPGCVMRDTEGKRIQAHGGAMFYENGTFYWYGENKERTDGKGPVWTWGIRAYASTDLYNWKDMGVFIGPDLENPDSPLYPERHVDRPHIIKCKATGKYVCWLKLSGEEGYFTVLSADALLGPYSVVREYYNPVGQEIGDFDLTVDKKTGKAYLYLDAGHDAVVGMQLGADYLSAEKEISRQYEGLHAPYSREGITVFEAQEKCYMLTSGMIGYIPNPSDAACAPDWESAFVSIGNPHENDSSKASFNSQISDVVAIPGKNLFLVMADRWVPDYPMDAEKSEMFERAVAAHFDPEHYHVSPKENEEYLNSPMLETANTSKADYVWLPMQIENGKPVIRWYESWRIEDFE